MASDIANVPAGSGSGIATDTAVVTVAADSDLSAERVLTGETNVLTVTDNTTTIDLAIAANGIGNAKLRDGGALTVIGRSANSSGDPADIAAVAASGAVLRESGSTVGFGTIATAGIAANAVTVGKMQQIAGLSVLGVTAGSTADMAAITAGSDGHILTRVSSTSLAFAAPAAAATDITGMSALAAGDFKPLTDQIPIYDASAAANRKTSFLNMMGGRGYAVMAEECWNAAGLTSGMGSSVNGGGTLANDVAEAAHPGTFLASVTSANDFAILDSAYANAIKWGAGKWRFLAIVQTPSSLSDGTHTYEIRAGFNDGGAGNGNDMVMFFYSHGTVSGNWAMVTRDNSGSTTTTDSGTAVATSTWYALEGETNADQTAVQFYINGVAAGAAVTAGLGTAGNGTKLHFSFMKTLGTSARTMKIDFLGCYFEPTTAR
jgi:hypothetical protein